MSSRRAYGGEPPGGRVRTYELGPAPLVRDHRTGRIVGGVEEIYVRHGRSDSGKAIGETWSGHAVHVDTDARPGEYVRARIESAGPHVLYAGEPSA